MSSYTTIVAIVTVCTGEGTSGFRTRCVDMLGDEQHTTRQEAHRRISRTQEEGARQSGSDEGEGQGEVGVAGGPPTRKQRLPDLCVGSGRGQEKACNESGTSSPLGKNLATPTNITSSRATPISGSADVPSESPNGTGGAGLLSPVIKVETPQDDGMKKSKSMVRCVSEQSVGLRPPGEYM